MPDGKTEILQEFDQVIGELQALIDDMPKSSNDRYSRGSSNYIAPEDRERFLDIRTRCLALLHAIKSSDVDLQQSIEYIRGVDVLPFNIKRVLHTMQSLRSDYASGTLTQHPRTIAKEKRPLLTNELTLIIVAIISVSGVIGSALISRSTVTVVATPTPTWTATSTETATPSSTPTATFTPFVTTTTGP